METRQIFTPLIILCRILGWNQVSRNFWDSKSRWVLVHFHWLSTKVNSLTVCFPSPPLLVIIRRKMQFYYVGNPSILKLPDYLKTFQVNLRLGWKIYNTFIVWGISIIDGWQNWALLWILNLEIDIDWLGSCVWFGFYAIPAFHFMNYRVLLSWRGLQGQWAVLWTKYRLSNENIIRDGGGTAL